MVVAGIALQGSQAQESKMPCWRPLTKFGIKSVFLFSALTRKLSLTQ